MASDHLITVGNTASMGSISVASPLLEGSTSLQNNGDVLKETSSAIRPHPLGVRPSGNALTVSHNLRDSSGTFNVLPDEVLMLLLDWLDPPSLLALGATCRALYAFTSNDELWRTLFIAYVSLVLDYLFPAANVLYPNRVYVEK